MTKCRFVLKVCTVTIVFTLLIASGVYAVEPWSNDLWKDTTPSINEGNTNGQQSGSSGGGLWSDQLWQNTPAPQPAVPPVGESKPVDNPLPANNPADNSYILVMQTANNKALVRGVVEEVLVPPTNINGLMMVPLRFTGEALNATFSWSDTERKTTMVLDGKKIEIWTGKSIATVNGNVVQLDTPPVVLDGSILVPIRFVSENFGYSLEYESISKIVKVRKAEQAASKPTPEPKPEPIQAPEEVKPSPDKGQVEPDVKKPVINSTFNYFGEWNLRTDAFSGSVQMGTLIVREDGTYGMKHGISGTAIGTWRQGAKDEVIGQKDMLILENGPGGMDWVMIPKSDGIVSIRYHYKYDIENKIWFVDSLGIKVK